MNIKKQIASAIKEADSSYFFENYEKQAESVIKALKAAGYSIVPTVPTEEMINKGKEAISYGASKPSDLIRNIYQAIINSI
jgi:predicted CoA-binding protein